MPTMTSLKMPRLDLRHALAGAAAQFRGLNVNDPGQWPPLPRLSACAVVAAGVLALAWGAVLSGSSDALQAERDREPALQQEWRSKYAQAANLAELRRQKLQVQEWVTQLEKQLPGKAEMDALLSDINQAGLGRGLQFELFRPGQEVIKDYYAELPIALRISGRYHDVGAFAADIANLSRIVTLHNLNLTAAAPGAGTGAGAGREAPLVLEATARTYRYLDAAEVAQQKKATAAAAKAGGKP